MIQYDNFKKIGWRFRSLVVLEEVAMEEERVVEEEVAMEEERVVEEPEVVEAEEAAMEAAGAEVMEAAGAEVMEAAEAAEPTAERGCLYSLIC